MVPALASHARHVLSQPGEVRVQLKFLRQDLLWRHDGVLENPYADQLRTVEGAVLSVPGLPMAGTRGMVVVGPTILDMTVRQLVRITDLPRPLQARAHELAAAARLRSATSWPVWSRRDPATLWPAPSRSRYLTLPREVSAGERGQDHPFHVALVSGGTPVPGAPSDEWQAVEKPSTVSIAEHAYRLAVGLCGSVPAAYTRIATMAVAAWDADRDRALRLWAMVGAAPDGLLLEDVTVQALRPLSSISQEVERAITREACAWLGLDPDLDVRRPRGRPRGDAGDEGEVIQVQVDAAGVVTGTFKSTYHGVPEGTRLSDLDVIRLAEVLGRLRSDNLPADADLLEAYLDAAVEDWREQVAAAAAGGGPGQPPQESPHDVLGVLPDTPMVEVAAAFRAQMQAVQHLPNTAPMRRLTEAFKAIKRERAP